MRSRARWSGAALATAALLAAGPAGAFDPGELKGKKSESAREKLSSKGYTHVRTDTSKKRAFEYWWSARDKKCVALVVDLKGKNQRVDDVAKVGKKECRR